MEAARFALADRGCLGVPCMSMPAPPLAVSTDASAALQLGPLAILGLLYARRVRTLADRRASGARLAAGVLLLRASW